MFKAPKGMTRFYSKYHKDGERDEKSVMSTMTADINNVLAEGKYILKSITEYTIFGGGFLVHFEEFVAPKPKTKAPFKKNNSFDKGYDKKPYEPKKFNRY